MKDLIKNIGRWFTENDKWIWLIAGLIIGFWADSFYCACYAGTVGIVAYICFYHKEWKMVGSYLLAALILLMSIAGQGLAYILTEQ